MSHVGTRTRTPYREQPIRSARVLDITDDTVQQRRAQRHAERSPHRSTQGSSQGSVQQTTTGSSEGRQENRQGAQAHAAAAASSRSASDVRGADTDIVRSLMFAQGLDERGGRLPLASDSMSEEERCPYHVVAERQGSVRRPAEFAEIYRLAERFDDGLPNVSAIRPLTHKVRVATSDEQSVSAAGSPLFAPREVPNHLRALPQRRELPTVDRRTVLAPTASVSAERSAERSPRPSLPSSVSTARTSTQTPRSKAVSAPRSITTDQRNHVTSASVAVGALALAEPLTVSASGSIAKPVRPTLHAVSAAPKRIASYGVVGFWVLFVMAFLFVAVVMHAGIAHRQMTLDEINVQLEQSEYANSQLRVEVASLQSPTRIADAAARLGLSSPTGIRFVQAIPASIAPASSGSVAGATNGTKISTGVAAGQTGG